MTDQKMQRFLNSLHIDNVDDFDMSFEMINRNRFNDKQWDMVIIKSTPWKYQLLRQFQDGLQHINYPYLLRFSYLVRPNFDDVNRLFGEWYQTLYRLPHDLIISCDEDDHILIEYISQAEKEQYHQIIEDFKDFLQFISYEFTITEVVRDAEEAPKLSKKAMEKITEAAEEQANDTLEDMTLTSSKNDVADRNDVLEMLDKGLVLPSSFAMSPKERAAIRAFARSGGVVLADIEPGPWTDRFVRTSPAKFPGMMVTGRLPEDSSSPAWAGIRKKIKKLLDEHGAAVKRPFLQPAYKAEVHQFELSGNGGELIAFWNYEGGTVSAVLPKGKFLYDVLRGSLIRKKSFSTIAGTPGVYVVLPYQVEGIQADISRSGREVSMNLKIQANAPLTRHVFLVEVFRAGKKFAPYSAVIEAPAGSAVHRFCTGIGENQKLSFIVTDVISGKQTKGEI